MRNIFNFIWRHQFVFLFLLFELIAFLLLAQTNKYHNASFYSKANSLSGGVYATFSNISEYVKLKDVNQKLQEENARLRENALNAYIKTRSPHVYVEDTLYLQQYRYLTANVIKNSTNRRSNYLILNQGSEQGITPEMGVISSSGIVGIVKDVSPHYCSVISLLHKDIQISVKIKKNEYFGILSWEGGNPEIAKLSDIPNHVDLSIGDEVVTRGSSTIFPTGITIGTINKIEKEENDDFYQLDVQLSTDFNNVSYVYIVKNLLKKEQLELEAKLEQDAK